ncbi:hypothetical protein [Corynebacterium halotolerans]|uniref:DivIVA domain-containing protein n=1 Tax=Corynebacterium halotolerans YIM 70093 = DSM 44683 TaxID=1121362 RepID=M1MWL8_9CORY|nr:hypothetical protein [Corynebacterium halotolerans]AGF72134.1 hypothetical protein A605_05640 [Corynebacterium halotolerans YIM 70093 = DSM 44683]
MLTWILLIVLLAALVVLGTFFWGKIFGRGEVLPPMDEPETVIEDNRRRVGAGQVDGIRFELVPRGYRPEQVDDVIEHLAWQVNEANRRITELSRGQRD